MKATIARCKRYLTGTLRIQSLQERIGPIPSTPFSTLARRFSADGSTLLLCRVEDRRGLSHLCAARSVNGVDSWQIDREPTLIHQSRPIPGGGVGH